MPMPVVLDFDQTITEQDTIGVLGTYAASKKDSPEIWDGICESYVSEHRAFADRYCPIAAERTSAPQELEFLAALRPVELTSLQRLGESGLFRGIGPDELYRLGRDAVADGRVRIRRGLPELLAQLQHASQPAAIVSVNWSEHFIRGCCSSVSGEEAGWESFSFVLANAIDEESGRIYNSTVPGIPVDGNDTALMTARDKSTAFSAAGQTLGKKPEELVYVGDSSTDLQCLVEAGRGIVIAAGDDEQEGLRGALKRLGYRVDHVGDGQQDGRLFWARDFAEMVESGIILFD